MPYWVTQCYLSPGRGDIPAFTPTEAGIQLRDPGGMQGWVDLGPRHCSKDAQPVPKTAYHNGIRDKHSRLQWDSKLGPVTSR